MKLRITFLLLCISITTVFATNWERLAYKPTFVEYTNLLVGPNDILWAGTWGDGIKQSINQGQTFTDISTGLGNLFITDIKFNDGVLLASTLDGIYKSLDNGQSWTATADLNSGRIKSVAVNSSDIFLAGTKGNGIYRTTDGGTTWNEANGSLFFQDVSIVMIAENGDFLAATNGRGLWRSSDTGETWERSNTGIESRYITDMQYDGEGKLWCSTKDAGIFMSVNDGLNWSPTYIEGIFDLNVQCFTLFFWESDNDYYPVLGLRNWGIRKYSPIFVDERYLETDVKRTGVLDMVTFSDGTMIASTPFIGINYSTDDGETWAAYPVNGKFPPETKIQAIDNYIFVADRNGISVSDDYGESFTQTSTTLNPEILDYKDGLLVAYSPGEILISDDNAQSFNSISVDLSGYPAPPAEHERAANYNSFDFDDADNMYIDLEVFYVYTGMADPPPDPIPSIFEFLRSTDGGNSWITQNSSTFDQFSSLEIQTDGDLYAVNKNDRGIYRSTNQGQDWSIVNSSTFSKLELQSAGSSRVYARTNAGLMISNNGTDFTVEDFNYEDIQYVGTRPSPLVNDFKIKDSFTMYAALNGNLGVYRTTDAGASWDSITYDVPNSRTRAVALSTEGEIYYGNKLLYSSPEEGSLPIVELLTPQNNLGGVAMDRDNPNGGKVIEFTWESAEKADMYEIQVSKGDYFASIVGNYVANKTSYILDQVLEPNELYAWRVRTRINDTYGAWSQVWRFSTVIDSPELISPADGENYVQTDPDLIWTEVDGATDYSVEISDISDFSNTIYAESNLSGTSTTSTGLEPISVYYWRAKAFNETTESGWSNSNSFTTITGVPELIYPANDDSEIPTSLTFTYEAVEQAELYNIQVSTIEDFSDPSKVIVDDRIEGDTYLFYDLLAANNVYYWRVRSGVNDEDGNGNITAKFGGWSDSNKFSTGLRAPNINLPENNSVDIDPVDIAFSWFSVSEATEYDFRLATDSEMSNIISETSTDNTALINQGTLSYYTEYWWQVRAKNDDGNGAWSSPSKFRTVMAAPIIQFPECESSVNVASTNVVWEEVDGAELYEVELSTDEEFTDIVSNPTDIDNDRTRLEDLSNGETYFWRVRGYNSESTGLWSNVCSFSIVTSVDEEIIAGLGLSLYPNPAKSKATLEFLMNHSKDLAIKTYTVDGKLVETLMDRFVQRGAEILTFNIGSYPEGTYLLEIQVGDKTISKTLQVIK